MEFAFIVKECQMDFLIFSMFFSQMCVFKVSKLRLPGTFRRGFSLTDAAPRSYITDTQTLYQILIWYRVIYHDISF